MRKNNPKLKELVDEFVKTHAAGTSFGNTLMRRYLESNQWITNPTNDEQIKKFKELANFFKTYSSEYGFDYLMVVAQGYQESTLNQRQEVRGRGGNHAGQTIDGGRPAHQHSRHCDGGEQYSRRSEASERDCGANISTIPEIDPEPALFTFAAYNAGPNRIAELRKRARPKDWIRISGLATSS